MHTRGPWAISQVLSLISQQLGTIRIRKKKEGLTNKEEQRRQDTAGALTMVSSRGSSAAGKMPSSLNPISVSRDVPG